MRALHQKINLYFTAQSGCRNWSFHKEFIEKIHYIMQLDYITREYVDMDRNIVLWVLRMGVSLRRLVDATKHTTWIEPWKMLPKFRILVPDANLNSGIMRYIESLPDATKKTDYYTWFAHKIENLYSNANRPFAVFCIIWHNCFRTSLTNSIPRTCKWQKLCRAITLSFCNHFLPPLTMLRIHNKKIMHSSIPKSTVQGYFARSFDLETTTNVI